MHDHDKVQISLKGKSKILLVGQPNVGKSVIFALLTGRYVTVSNYPGTTVEVCYGLAKFAAHGDTVIVDTPGINSLIAQSEDEKVTRQIILEESPKAIIQVADSKNLKRSLLLTITLIELGFPVILDLNMYDEARERGIKIDTHKLSSILDLVAVETIATEKIGINKIISNLALTKPSSFEVKYPKIFEEGIEKIGKLLPSLPIKAKAAALMILSYDQSFEEYLISKGTDKDNLEKIKFIRDEVQRKFPRPVSFIISQHRAQLVDKIVGQTTTISNLKAKRITERLGHFATSPVWGWPVVLLVLYAMYEFVGVFAAGTGVDFLENKIFGEYLNPWISHWVNLLIPFKIIQELLIGPYGLITMALTYSLAIILPIVGAFFIFFGLLEDSGYLPRLALMVNRIFKVMGLHGKAVLPMVLGLGCDTMATVTTRILETKKERIIVTLLLALAIPCSAQLGVIMAMLSGSSAMATIIWAAVLIAVLFIIGYLSSKVIPGAASNFILEIPPLRIPQMSNILIKTWARIEWYLKEAVPLFILGTFILFVLDKTKLLLVIEKISSPLIVNILGLPAQATSAFLIGFLRRDYGAAGLYMLAKQGKLDGVQIVVSLVTITLFVPCIAQFFMTIKERGLKVALLIIGFIFPFAIIVGGLLNYVLRLMAIKF